MTRFSKRKFALAATVLLALLAPSAALAGGKGGGGKQAGGDKPTESLSINYTKIPQEYKPQNDDGTLRANSKVQTNKSNPNLFKSTAQGKHYSRVSH